MRAAPLIAATIAFGLSLQGAAACEGCGCRGGPGYRGPDGHCVGWARLNRVCGNPPTTNCTYEGGGLATGPNAAAPKGKSGSRLTEQGIAPDQEPTPPIAANVQQAKADGLGCVDQAIMEAVSSCTTSRSADDCDRQREELIRAKACFVIAGGTAAAIEASSHSFDWLRVRVPGTVQPLWTARALFLSD